MLGVSGGIENGLALRTDDLVYPLFKCNYLVPVVVLFLMQKKMFCSLKVYGQPVFSQSSVSKKGTKCLEGKLNDLARCGRLGETDLTPVQHCNKSVQ